MRTTGFESDQPKRYKPLPELAPTEKAPRRRRWRDPESEPEERVLTGDDRFRANLALVAIFERSYGSS
jgi:hypothetical protein